MARLFFFLSLLLACMFAQARSPSPLLEQALLKDPDSALSVEQVAQARFETYVGNLGLGFQPGAVWLRLTIDQADSDDNEASRALVLRVGPNYLERIELFQWQDGRWQQQARGSLMRAAGRACPDDLHCFEITAKPSEPTTVYLRIAHEGFLVTQVEVLPARDLSAAVAKRVRAISVSLSVALCLLAMGVVLLLTDRSVLLAAYCGFQLTVLLFIASNAGMVAAVLPGVSDTWLNLLNNLLYVLRVTVTGLLVWAFLQPHRPSPMFLRGCQVMLAVCGINALLVAAGHTQPGMRGSLLVFSLLPFWFLYGTFSAASLPTAQRRVLLVGILVFMLMLILGLWLNLSTWSEMPRVGLVKQIVDWRLNGFAVGVLFFWLTMLESSSQKRARAQEFEALRQQALDARARQAELDERSALIDMLTHELKNPLGTIGFALASLRQQLGGSRDAAMRLQSIEASAHRMDDLIERVASLSKIERATPSDSPPLLDAAALVQELLADMPEPQQWRVEVQPQASFRCDRQMLWVILENLMTNASKYGLPGHVLRLKVAWQDAEPSVPGGAAQAPPARLACFDISNRVDPACVPDADSLFERYYRHPNVLNKAGMGLGLSVVKAAADKIGGTVSFRHEGDQVFFTLKVPA